MPVAPIAALPEVLAEEQLGHRGLTHTLQAPAMLDTERVTSITTGFVANTDGPSAKACAPRLGAHTEEILCEIGLLPDEITALRDKAVVSG